MDNCEMPNNAYPNFIGIGAQRCGTTWLDVQLRRHPDIYLPTRRKEVHYFDQYYDRGPAWYQASFPADKVAGFTAVGEITPKYLFDRQAPARIKLEFPDARLIAILRNPVERAYSQFGLYVARYGQADGFERFLANNPEAIDRGLYHDQLQRYFALFPRRNILVLLFEEVMAYRVAALDQVCAFLGVRTGALDGRAVNDRIGGSDRPRFPAARALATKLGNYLRDHDLDWAINAAKRAGVLRLFGNRGRIAPIEPELHALLGVRFAPDIARLEVLLDRNLDLWRAPESYSSRRAAP
jgi:hypothetical protein